MSTQIKGSVLLARRAFVDKHFGDAAWPRVLQTLSDEDRTVLLRLLPIGWYSFQLGDRVDKAIVQVLGGGRPDVFLEIGALSAQENLTGVHRTFLRAGDPAGFMKLAPAVYKFYYDEGHRTWEPTGPNSGVMTTHGAETFSTSDCLTIVGWYQEALKMCGAKSVEIVEEECRANGGQVCRYRMKWTTPSEVER